MCTSRAASLVKPHVCFDLSDDEIPEMITGIGPSGRSPRPSDGSGLLLCVCTGLDPEDFERPLWDAGFECGEHLMEVDTLQSLVTLLPTIPSTASLTTAHACHSLLPH